MRPSSTPYFFAWWALDVLLAWSIAAENVVIKVERWIVHLLAAALFILGSAKEGEIWLSRTLGFFMLGAIAMSIVARLATRPRLATPGSPPYSPPR